MAVSARLTDCCRELFDLISCVEMTVRTRCPSGRAASRLVEVLVRSSVRLSPLCTQDMKSQTAASDAMVTHLFLPVMWLVKCMSPVCSAAKYLSTKGSCFYSKHLPVHFPSSNALSKKYLCQSTFGLLVLILIST